MRNDPTPVTMADLHRENKALETSLEAEIASWKREIGVEFEKLRQDILGAIGDIRSLLTDEPLDHEQRICRFPLEQRRGADRSLDSGRASRGV